jgi:Common central domain of tyrosinase
MTNGNQIFVRHEARSPAGVEALEAYAAGVAKLKERPVEEPSSWAYQAAMHGTAMRPLQPLWRECEHQSWFFLPWHRMYLYYFEGIVRKAVTESGGSADWALPYWNYSEGEESRKIPPQFREPADEGNPLFAPRFDYVNEGKPLPEEATLAEPALARPSYIGVAEFGGGDGPPERPRFWGQAGVLENTPHNAVHSLIGGWMRNPETAGQDPVFWLHHANIDRLWAIWNEHEEREDPTQGEWLEKSFEFFRADGQRVAKKCGEVRNTVADLAYTYDPAPAAIVEELVPPTPPPPPPGAPPPPEEPKFVGASEGRVPLSGETVEVPVEIDPRAREEVLEAANPEDPRRLYLNIEDIEGETNPGTVYGIYLNLPRDPSEEELERHYLGNLSFFGIENVARPTDDEHPHGMRVSVEVGDLVRKLRDDTDWDRESLAVCLRPIAPELTGEEHEPIHIGRVSLAIDA